MKKNLLFLSSFLVLIFIVMVISGCSCDYQPAGEICTPDFTQVLTVLKDSKNRCDDTTKVKEDCALNSKVCESSGTGAFCVTACTPGDVKGSCEGVTGNICNNDICNTKKKWVDANTTDCSKTFQLCLPAKDNPTCECY